MNDAMIDAMAQRLAWLERRFRRWKLTGLGFASLAAIFLLLGAGRQAQPQGLQADRMAVRDLEAQRIVLKDDHGVPGSRWNPAMVSPRCYFEGPPGNREHGLYHILFVVNRDGVPVPTFTGKDNGTVMLGVNPAGEPHLTLSGKRGALTYRTSETGSPQLMLWDKDGRGRIRLGLKPDGSPAIEPSTKKSPRLHKTRATRRSHKRPRRPNRTGTAQKLGVPRAKSSCPGLRGPTEPD